MLTFVWANIGYALTFLLVVAVIRCFMAKTTETYFMALALGFIAWPAWLDVWTKPADMAVIHFFIMTGTLMFMHGHLHRRLAVSLLLMVLADSTSAICLELVPAEEAFLKNRLFWWRSVLNVIFVYQCAIAITGSTEKALAKSRSQVNDDHFMARTASPGKS